MVPRLVCPICHPFLGCSPSLQKLPMKIPVYHSISPLGFIIVYPLWGCPFLDNPQYHKVASCWLYIPKTSEKPWIELVWISTYSLLHCKFSICHVLIYLYIYRYIRICMASSKNRTAPDPIDYHRFLPKIAIFGATLPRWCLVNHPPRASFTSPLRPSLSLTPRDTGQGEAPIKKGWGNHPKCWIVSTLETI